MHRILHINDYPAEAGGGAEVVMRVTIDLLRQRGLTVDTFTSADLAVVRASPLRYIDNPDARRALAAKLEAFRPDVVHLHNYYHVLSPGILSVLDQFKQMQPMRVVMTAHDYHLASPNSGGSWFRRWTGRREAIDAQSNSPFALLTHRWDHRGSLHSLLKLLQYTWNYRWHRRQRVIDLVICPSRFVQAMLEPLGLPTCWLPHPAPTPPPNLPARSGPLSFVFAGRIEPEKGLEEFLRILPAEFTATITIIGSGEHLSHCQAICAKKGLTDRVQFVGRLPHDETMARIAGSHALVQSSRVLETYGLTLVEALSCGTNVLAANRGAAREIVEAAGVGFLYDLDDAGSLAVQLQAIGERHQDGSLNRFNIAAFLEERSATRYVEQLIGHYEND